MKIGLNGSRVHSWILAFSFFQSVFISLYYTLNGLTMRCTQQPRYAPVGNWTVSGRLWVSLGR
jgi:hypothetical protein